MSFMPGKQLGGAHGLQAAVRLAVQLVPVLDATQQRSNVDEVKGVVFPRPLVLCVVNLEAYVGRDVCRLHRRQLGADNVGVGVLLAELTITAWSDIP